MPKMSFHPDEFGSLEEASETYDAEHALQSLESSPAAPVAAADPIAPELMDVDLRLSIADHYRGILNHEFFQDTSTKAAQLVSAETREFITGRLKVLLGITADVKQEPVKQLFTEEEAQALKALADPQIVAALSAVAKLALKKPSVTEPTPPKAPVKKTPLATTTKPVPVTRAPAVVTTPALPVTKPAAPVQKAVPTQPLEKKEAPPPPEPPKPAPAEPKPQPAPKQAKEPKVKKAPIRPPAPPPQVVGDDEEPILEAGKTFTKKGRIFKVFKRADGSLYTRDVTPQVAPPGYTQATPDELALVGEQEALKREAMMNRKGPAGFLLNPSTSIQR